MELTNYKDFDKIANPYIVKCILLGDRGIGKSTMVTVLSTGRFDPTISSTVGIDFKVKNITLSDYNNHKIKLQIWDTAGQEKFKSIIKSYLRDVYIGFLVFDLTNRESWNNLINWKEDLERYNRYSDIPLVVLVGTKADLNEQVIHQKEIDERAKEWGCKYYMISSRQENSAIMIRQMFSSSAENLHKIIIHKHIHGQVVPGGVYKDDESNIYKINRSENDNKSNWCCFH